MKKLKCLKLKEIRNKLPACNGRFGASGGVGSSEREQVTSLFALVQTAVNPPPAAKPLGRWAQVNGMYSGKDNVALKKK